MRARFNHGRAYHGSDAVQDGQLRGATDKTDYFYFFCPKCPDDQIVRVLDVELRVEKAENKYNSEFTVKANGTFNLGFKFRCESCGLIDFFKVSNDGWQGGPHEGTLH